MGLLSTKCYFCRKNKLVLLYPHTTGDVVKIEGEYACTSASFGHHEPIVKCQNCGLVYLDEGILQEELSSYYEIEDPKYLEEQLARRKTFEHYLRRVESFKPCKGKLLDVGASTGLFVDVALKNGWNAYGVETNKWAVECSKELYGLQMVNDSFKRELFPKESFDVVTMWDVIEHFADPLEEMKNVNWYLKEGGLFAFSTIDAGSVIARLTGSKWSWFMQMHRYYFDKKTIAMFLKKAGFGRIVFRPHFRYLSLGYLSTRVSAYNRILSKSVEEVLKKLRLDRVIIPYYANDLFDCFAYKE